MDFFKKNAGSKIEVRNQHSQKHLKEMYLPDPIRRIPTEGSVRNTKREREGEKVEREKFDTCKHVKRVGNFAVYTKSTCNQATMIRGQLVVGKARCLKCELWEPKKTGRKKEGKRL